MARNGSVLGLVGSPNRDGRTYQMVTAALEGAARAGARVELVQMADHVVEACKDCLPWECKDTLKCAYPDAAFEYLSAALAGMAGARQPFAGVEERLLWYDGLPYLSLSRAGERRLLAALTTAALSETADPAIPRGLAQADALAARGEHLRALQEITRAYEAGVKVFEGSQG